MPLTESFVVLAGGLVVVRRAVARFTAEAAVPFLVELQRTGPLDVGFSETGRLAEALARSGVASREPSRAASPHGGRPRARAGFGAAPRDGRHERLARRTSVVRLRGTVVPARRRFGVILRPCHAPRHSSRRGGGNGRHSLPARGRVSPRPWCRARARARLASPAARRAHADWRRMAGRRSRACGTARRRLSSWSVSSGIDWFDLEATVSFGGTVVPVTEILAALKPGVSSIRLGDGSVGLLPDDWADRVRTSDGGRRRSQAATFGFAKSQAAMLDALLASRELDTAVRVDAVFAQARAELAAWRTVTPLEAPSTFVGSLRGYQREGLGWFDFLRRFGFGGCLADDMGLGKTVMVLALVDARRQAPLSDHESRRPSLVVVPRSLVGNWLAEAAHFTPELRVTRSFARLARHRRHLVRRGGPRRRDLWDVEARYRGALDLGVRLRDSRRGTDDQKRHDRRGQGRAPACPPTTGWRCRARRSRTTWASCGASSSSSTRACLASQRCSGA